MPRDSRRLWWRLNSVPLSIVTDCRAPCGRGEKRAYWARSVSRAVFEGSRVALRNLVPRSTSVCRQSLVGPGKELDEVRPFCLFRIHPRVDRFRAAAHRGLPGMQESEPARYHHRTPPPAQPVDHEPDEVVVGELAGSARQPGASACLLLGGAGHVVFPRPRPRLQPCGPIRPV
jgi:hypothetical protein